MRHAISSRRAGTVTIIVISFLLLLLIMGLTFAFYGLREAKETAVYANSQNGGQTGVTPTSRKSSGDDQPPDPENIFNRVIGEVIYGPQDDYSGAYNGLRGHDLGRTIYGWDPKNPTTNTAAYVGFGHFPPSQLHGAGVSDQRINWGTGDLLNPDNNYTRDPATGQYVATMNDRYIAMNAPYTYPDQNNIWLAVVDPKSGRVLKKSYDHITGVLSGNPPLNPDTGPVTGLPPTPVAMDMNDWTNAVGRQKMIRPRPVDHQIPGQPGSSYWLYPKQNPDGTYGDVELLDNKPGGRQYDSVWVDADLPVQFWQGKRYKPMVAFLIRDLDGSIDLNSAGNYYAQPGVGQPPVQPRYPGMTYFTHGSNQGLGPWEINPGRVFAANEAMKMSLQTRYGTDVIPNKRFFASRDDQPPTNMPTMGNGGHYYCQIDFDGHAPPPGMTPSLRYFDAWTGHETSMSFGLGYVGTKTAMADSVRPEGTSRYGLGMRKQFDPMQPWYDERLNHPGMYNPLLMRDRSMSAGDDRTYGVSFMRNLGMKFNYGDSGKSEVASYREPQYDMMGNAIPNTYATNSLLRPRFNSGELNPRFAVSSITRDFDLPGASPWLAAPATLQFPPTGRAPNQPTSTAVPAPLTPPTPAAPGADYDISMKATMTQLGAVDVNRKLTDYRSNIFMPYSSGNLGNQMRADQDRRELAKDIFDRLRFATTGVAPSATPIPPADIPALRWLAQLSVNIVDYVDSDDIMTVFPWNPLGTSAREQYVVGFERPKLVINETYTRLENDPGEMPNTATNPPTATMPYSVRMWVELHNPSTPATPGEDHASTNGYDPTTQTGGYKTRLTETGAGEYSSYRMVIHKYRRQMMAASDPGDVMQMRSADNVFGEVNSMAMPAPKIVDFADAMKVKHHDAARNKAIDANIGAQYGPNNSFYILGPAHDMADPMGAAAATLNTASPITAHLTHEDLSESVTDPADITTDMANPMKKMLAWSPGFVLQRLANPYMTAPGAMNAHNPVNVANPQNIYVTVDYQNPDWKGDSVYDRIQYTTEGDRASQPDFNTTFSWGRRQPMDGTIDWNNSNNYRQENGGAPAMNNIGNSFNRHNGSNQTAFTPGDQKLQLPFNPLLHLDRGVISPGEFVHATAVKPTEFTHVFKIDGFGMGVGTQRWAHTANWFDDNRAAAPETPAVMNAGQVGPTYLWRALDFLKCGGRVDGNPIGGRVAGRVNINTIFATEVFEAVCDQNTANRFQPIDVNTAMSMLAARTPGFPNVGINDRPFSGSAAAVTSNMMAPNTTGVHTTIYRPNALHQPLGSEQYQQGANAGALQKYELLSKVANQFTTRSNVFAVHMCVGYFEVLNAGPYNEVTRPILGKELGIDEGTTVRHRFFSVIDRTNLSIEQGGTGLVQGPAPTYFSYQPEPDAPTIMGSNNFVDPQTTANGRTSVVVRIPATGVHTTGGQRIYGFYDGQPWQIADNAQMVIGSGAAAELVSVGLIPVTAMTPNGSYDPTTGTARLQLTPVAPNAANGNSFMQSHHRGAALRLQTPTPFSPAATVPGHPGPQPGFNYKSPRYAPVVRYVEEIK